MKCEIATVNAYCLRIERAFRYLGVDSACSDNLRSNLPDTVTESLLSLRLITGNPVVDDWIKHYVFESKTMTEAVSSERHLLEDLLDQLKALLEETVE